MLELTGEVVMMSRAGRMYVFMYVVRWYSGLLNINSINKTVQTVHERLEISLNKINVGKS